MKWMVALLLLLVPATAFSAEPSVESLESIHAQPKMRNGKIYELNVNCKGYTNSEYLLIRQLTDLKVLSISGKNFNDRQLKMLTTLKQLERVMINEGELTDEGYQLFTEFPKLNALSIFHPTRDRSAFTGAGLAHLKDVPTLRSLTFAGAAAGDEALEAVGEVTQLESFREWHNKETSQGLHHLTKLANLKLIHLGQRLPPWGQTTPASFDNKTLAILAKMPSLEVIELTEARLDYDGIIQLKNLPNLRTIKIQKVDISQDDIERLKADMPKVKFNWQPLTDKQEKQLSDQLKL